jgi:hypothetical protein
MSDPGEQPAEATSAPEHGPPHVVHVAYEWTLALFLVMGAVQIFLAGLGIFSLSGGGPGFDPHRILGFAMAGVALVIVVLAAVTHAGRTAIGAAVLLFLLAALGQSLLAALGREAAFWGGLHALDGLVILGLAAFLQRQVREGNAGR